MLIPNRVMDKEVQIGFRSKNKNISFIYKIMLTRITFWNRDTTSVHIITAAALIALFNNIVASCLTLVKSGPVKHKCQVQPPVKMSVSPLYRPAASTHATGSLTKSIDFPKTNYPSVRDLTHKFWTAGGFSDFNHTSMLAPQSNLHCLSLTPALCQLYID